MAKATNDKATDVDIWAGSIEEVKARVKAVLNDTIQIQKAAADDATRDEDSEAFDAHEHTLGVVEWIRAQLFGE